jgi:collagenase-like PrtC family protease
MLENCPHFFRDGVEIASVYGSFPPSLWNGGRMQLGVCDKSYVKAVIKAFNDKGIPLRFTFTNPVLEKKHLSDNFCNMVMNLANNGMNGVIVVSPLLEDYIRKNYPDYKITSSTCKRITNSEILSDELERDYNIVVIDYDLNNRFDVLEKIPHKEKCEILVNACCNPECGYRTEHYKAIGEYQIAYANHVRKYQNVPFNVEKYISSHPESNQVFTCGCVKRTIFDIKNLPTHITPDDIWNKYVPMGFTQFKIEGRTLDIFNLLEHYIYYMIKPEFKDEARYTMLGQLRANGVIAVDE